MSRRVLGQAAGDDELLDRHPAVARRSRRSPGCRRRSPRAARGRRPRAGSPASGRRPGRTARGRPAPSGCRCASRARPGRARRPPGVAARSVRCSCSDSPAAAACVGVRRRDAGLDEPAEDVADAALAGLVAPRARRRCRRRRRRTCPGTSRSTSALITWQVEVPMIATIWPGPTACAAGRGDVGVDVADRDRDARRAARSRRPPRRSARRRGRRAGRSGGRACRRRSRRSRARAPRGSRRDG